MVNLGPQCDGGKVALPSSNKGEQEIFRDDKECNGACKCNFHSLFGNYDRPIDKWINKPTDWMDRSYVSYTSSNKRCFEIIKIGK